MSDATDVAPLFAPLTINGLTVPNRFLMPSMQRGWGDEQGRVTQKTTDYYCDRARGGTGLILTEGIVLDHPASWMDIGELHLTPDTAASWSACAAQVKAAGGNFLMQLWHPGAVRMEGQGPLPDELPISPSGIFADKPRGRAMEAQDLEEVTAAWVTASVTAQRCGFDGVEIHMAHGYLLHQFLWEQMNHREDGYGGPDMADRVRFPAQVLRAVRAAVGPDFVVSCRISQWAEWDYDAKIAKDPGELRVLISTLEEAGADMFHMSSRFFHKPEWPELGPLGLAGWVKTMTDLPVVTVGSVGLNVDLMQTLYSDRTEKQTLASSLADLMPRFAAGEFDMVAVGRSSIGDPEFVNKVRDGRLDDVRPFTRADLFDILGGLDGHDVPEEILRLAQNTADV